MILQKIKKFQKSKKAQVMLGVLFIAAITLIFYAVVISMGKQARTKAAVDIAATIGVSQQASYMASYAQQMFQVTLGGKNPKCGLTGAFATIVGAVLAVIIIAITWGAGSPAALAVVVALSAASYGMEIAINAKINSMWDRQVWDSLDAHDAVIEMALRSALLNIATDPKLVPDMTDLNQNFEFGPDGDEVPRRDIYYHERVKALTKSGPGGLVKPYMKDLYEFIYPGDDGWGLIDHEGVLCDPVSNNNAIPSECNPCCVSSDIRPYWCDKPEFEIDGVPRGTTDYCDDLSPFPDKELVWDQQYEDQFNQFFSLNETFGVDDERKGWSPDDEHPKYVDTPVGQTQIAGAGDWFWADPSGYYPRDFKQGVFPFWWKIKEFRMELNAKVKNDPEHPSCHLCDPTDPSGDCTGCQDWETLAEPYNESLPIWYVGRKITQLSLPNDPESNPMINWNDTWEVDGTNNNKEGAPPLATDIMHDPVEDVTHPDTWQAGADRYSGTSWPPFEGHTPNDLLDRILYGVVKETGDGSNENSGTEIVEMGIKPFVEWAKYWLRNERYAIMNYDAWCNSNQSVELMHSKAQTGLQKNIHDLKEMLRNYNKRSYATSCDTAWCVPSDPDNCQSEVSEDEAATFDWNENGVVGDMEDVIACLDYNVSSNITGDQLKDLSYCLQTCDVEVCNQFVSMTKDDCTHWGEDDPDDLDTGLATTERVANPKYEIVHQQMMNLLAAEDPLAMGNPAKFSACLGACDEGWEEMGDLPDECDQLPRPAIKEFDPKNDFDLFWDGTCAADYGDGDPATTEDNNWYANLQLSAVEAENQVIKMQKRRNYLIDVQTYLRQMLKFLPEAEAKMSGFFSNTIGCKGEFPKTNVIYGWQEDESVADDGITVKPGKWHIVRVDAEGPARFPAIRTWTKFLGTTRCYAFDEATKKGTVKVQVSRFDEEQYEDDEGDVSFANGLKLWTFKTSRPDAGPVDLSLLADPAACGVGSWTDAPFEGYEDIYQGAFILPSVSGKNDSACRQRANAILNQAGVSSTQCAEYFFQEGDKKGFTFKFVPCN